MRFYRHCGFGGREVQINLKNDLLLTKGYGGLTAWDMSEQDGNKEVLETVWVWSREVQINLKDDLFLDKGYGALTAWDIQADYGNMELETLWFGCRNLQINLKDYLFSSQRI